MFRASYTNSQPTLGLGKAMVERRNYRAQGGPRRDPPTGRYRSSRLRGYKSSTSRGDLAREQQGRNWS